MIARPVRSAFSLMEILIATMISLMLLGALYVSYDLSIKRTQASREVSQRSSLTRSVFNMVEKDISSSLGPLTPKCGGGVEDQGGTTTESSSTETGSESSSSDTTTPSTSSGSTGSSGSTTSTETSPDTASSDVPADGGDPDASIASAPVTFQAGVMGTDNELTIFVSRLPSYLANRQSMFSPEEQNPSDLKRITYYLSSTGRGLCRQERAWVTAEEVQNSVVADRSTEATDLIADEVVGLSFEYLDGSSWTGSWDGSIPSLDGTSTTGPPRAVRMILTIEYRNDRGELLTRDFSHVIPVRSSVGLIPPPEAPAEDTESTTPAE